MTTTRTKTPLVGWAILVPSSNRTPSVTRSVLARRPLPTAFPGRSGRGSSRTPHRCRHRQVFAGRVMPVNPRAVVDSLKLGFHRYGCSMQMRMRLADASSGMRFV